MAMPKRDHRKVIPQDVAALIEKANSGDVIALGALQTRFDEDPSLVAWCGDVLGLARGMIAALVARDAPAVIEAIIRQADAMEAELADEAGSELERLMIRRLTTAWLWTAAADVELVQAKRQTGQGRVTAVREATHQLDRAAARLQAASKGLAQVRQLRRSPRSPLQLVRGATSQVGANRFHRRAAGSQDPDPAGTN